MKGTGVKAGVKKHEGAGDGAGFKPLALYVAQAMRKAAEKAAAKPKGP